jgi:PAS domain S-box-containing protein
MAYPMIRPDGFNMRYKINPLSLTELRRLARERHVVPSLQDAAALGAEEVRRLLEELAISRIELEIQNEYLQDTYARVELALGQSRDFYDFAPVGCATCNAQGHITMVNVAGSDMLGLEPASLLRRPFDSFFLPEQRAHIRKLMAQATRTGENQRCDLTLADPHLFCRHLQLDLAPTLQGLGCHLVMTDISERNQAEDRLREDEERWTTWATACGTGRSARVRCATPTSWCKCTATRSMI